MNGLKQAEIGNVNTQEPIHLTAVRLPVYLVAAVLAVGPIAPGAGLVAALVGVSVGLWAGRSLAASKFRSLAIVGAAAVVTAIGLLADRLIGGPAWVAGLIGYKGTLAVVEVITFGLPAFGLTAGLRAIATRHPSWGGIEVLAVASIIVGLFSGHRNSQIGRPQFFSDWALSRGYDPVQLLMWIGLGSAFACGLLLLRPQQGRRTIVSILALTGLAATLWLVGGRFAPELRPDLVVQQPDQPPPQPNPGPNPNPGPPPRPRPPKNDPKPVAIVNLLDDLKVMPKQLYFRMKAQSGVDGGRLVEAGPAFDAEIPHGMPSSWVELATDNFPANEALFQDVQQRISTIVKLEGPIGMVAARVIEPRPVADPEVFQSTYRVLSRMPVASLVALSRTKVGDPSWSAETRSHYLVLPADHRYKAKAEAIIAAGLKPEFQVSPALKALTLLNWIKGNTTYTLHPRPMPDQTAAFLFDGEPGKCTEVAHAMVFMLRSLGIPARAATGFSAPSARMGTGSALLLQDSDGHQWPEVYFEGVGWVVVDISPDKSLGEPEPQPDPASQARYADKNRELDDKRIDEIRNADLAASRRPLIRELAATLGLAPLLAVLGAVLVKTWRRLAPRWASASRLDRVGYRAVLDRLAEVGLTRQFGESRGEFAARVGRIIPDFVAATEAFDRRVLTGEGGLDRAAWLELDTRIAALVAEEFTRRRRLIGVANPLAWRQSR